MTMVLSLDFQHLFRCRLDTKPPTFMFERQTITVIQWLRFGEVQQHGFAIIGGQPQTTSMPVVKTKGDTIDIITLRPISSLSHHHQSSHTHLGT